jgi:hypothetical protein
MFLLEIWFVGAAALVALLGFILWVLGDKYLGLPYDIYFGWQNDRIYCTELVWKIYKEILGIELGRLGKLKDFDLSSFTVRLLMFKRYGLKIPYDEPVIAPSTMFDSKELETVDTIN